MHYLTGSDTTSYLYGKGKLKAISTLLRDHFSGLDKVLGEQEATQADLMATANKFMCSLYGVTPGTSMGQARYQLYTKKGGKPLKYMALPPTDSNLMLHMLRVHHAMILAKAACYKDPPSLDMTSYGWSIQDGSVMPVISTLPPGPDDLMDAIACSRAAAGKACSALNCSCHKDRISCTMMCKCIGEDNCHNLFKVQEKTHDETDDEYEYNDQEENIDIDI